MRVVESLNKAIFNAIESDPTVLILGEDILDPYGGAFKVTKGISSHFPDNVFGTPISEQAIVGLATGLAIQGFKPVVEIMFGDFITLIVDQIVNHISKISSMYGERVPLSMIIRTPMGGRRGYGPTHSQSLERLLVGHPGIHCVAVSSYYSPGLLLEKCLELEAPVFFIENKTLYPKPIVNRDKLGFAINDIVPWHGIPTLHFAPDTSSDVTIVTYGGMVDLCREAMEKLSREQGLICDIVVPHHLSPLDVAPICEAVQKTKRVVVVEEGITAWGWGSEVAALLLDIQLEAPVERVGARSIPIPACRSLENKVLPQIDDIYQACIKTVDKSYVLRGKK